MDLVDLDRIKTCNIINCSVLVIVIPVPALSTLHALGATFTSACIPTQLSDTVFEVVPHSIVCRAINKSYCLISVLI